MVRISILLLNLIEDVVVVVVVVIVSDNDAVVGAVVVGDGGVVEVSNQGVFGRIGCTNLSLQHKPYSSFA